MPPKKIDWGEIPHDEHVKKKDPFGKWIECGVCNQTIKIRATFGFTEWLNHCSSTKHSSVLQTTEMNNSTTKLTKYFSIKPGEKRAPSNSKFTSTKRNKTVQRCPGFSYGKNSDLLQLYNKYQKIDELSAATMIVCQDGKWSFHSKDCTHEAFTKRNCKRLDKNACPKCYDFPFISKVKDRVKRMDKIYHIEKYLTETQSSQMGYVAISNFLKANVISASPNILLLKERCSKYLKHQKWLEENHSKLKEYNVFDQNGKVHHQAWLKKVGQMYSDEPSMKSSLLHALMHFTLSRYKGDVNAPASPKLIAFFQTLYALSPSIYRLFSKNFGGYNERTLRRMSSKCSLDQPIINCDDQEIKARTKKWIDLIREENPKKLLLVSAMADATKVPALGEFCHKYNAWVGGIYPNHCINVANYDQEKIVTNKLATEIKVGLLSLQDGKDGVSPFKIISARPQSTNERCDEYNYSVMNSVKGLENVFCISIAFDGLSTETDFIRTNLIAFMKGSSNTVAMTDCNHAAKNIRSQLVLGSTIITAGEALFDV